MQSIFIYYFHDCYDRRCFCHCIIKAFLHFQNEVSNLSSIDGVGINLFQLAFEISSSTKRKSGWQICL